MDLRRIRALHGTSQNQELNAFIEKYGEGDVGKAIVDNSLTSTKELLKTKDFVKYLWCFKKDTTTSLYCFDLFKNSFLGGSTNRISALCTVFITPQC